MMRLPTLPKVKWSGATECGPNGNCHDDPNRDICWAHGDGDTWIKLQQERRAELNGGTIDGAHSCLVKPWICRSRYIMHPCVVLSMILRDERFSFVNDYNTSEIYEIYDFCTDVRTDCFTPAGRGWGGRIGGMRRDRYGMVWQNPESFIAEFVNKVGKSACIYCKKIHSCKNNIRLSVIDIHLQSNPRFTVGGFGYYDISSSTLGSMPGPLCDLCDESFIRFLHRRGMGKTDSNSWFPLWLAKNLETEAKAIKNKPMLCA